MKSFLSDRPRVSTPAITIAPPVPFVAAAGGVAPVSPPLRPSAHAHAGVRGAASSKVECVREGERVTRIIVTCVCGERIEVDCLYPAET